MSDDLSGINLVDVTNPNYTNFNAINFFGGTDPIRIIINIYILLSIILNGFIFTVSLIFVKKIKSKLVIWLLLAVLFMNFIHTATYSYEWVIKDDKYVKRIETDVKDLSGNSKPIPVGALLTGNPSNLGACYLQGFFLIFSSISQDFLINIYFFLINSSSEINTLYAKLAILILGILVPLIFTLILHFGFEGIGLNDEFCYVKKFEISIKDGKAQYKYFINFQPFVMTVYFVRIMNCIFTAYFLHIIVRYLRRENQSISYFFKLTFIATTQVITITIGVIYRFANLFSPISSTGLSAIYLIINTADGFLFPIGFGIQNGIFSQFYNLITGNIKEEDDEKSEGAKQMEIMDRVDDYDGP